MAADKPSCLCGAAPDSAIACECGRAFCSVSHRGEHRDLHYGNCPAQYWDDATNLVAVVRADERAKVRVELLGCVTCGQVHEYRQLPTQPPHTHIRGTWADPSDGHDYRRRSIDDIADRIAPEVSGRG